MPPADVRSLQLHPDAANPELAQQQLRFNALVEEVALWRAALAGWQERMARYHQAVEPVRRELLDAWQQWVLALEHASLQAGLSRAERDQLAGLARDTAAALGALDDDAESAVDAAPASSDTGPLADLAEEWERQAAAAAAQRAERARQRREAGAAKRRRQQEQEVSGSVRDVYRRLASALHPDREPEAQKRAEKTALMQRANRAYAEGNLLVLLELQLQAEQIDAAHLASVKRQRLQHYVAVLHDQVAQLQAEARRLESDFRAATGLPPGTGLQARKADRMIASEARRMREDLQILRRQARALADVEATKAWLREQRKAGGA